MSAALVEIAAEIARRHRLGSVGIAGPHALGTATAADAVDVFVCVDVDSHSAQAFALEFSEAAQSPVLLHDVRRVPWPSQLHLCVKWANVDTLPRVPYPRGACTRVKLGELAGRVPLASIPHMQAIDGAPPTPPLGRATQFYHAPVGGFLI